MPYADQALQHTRFSAASIEGNAVATRLPVIVPVGLPRKARAEAVPPSLRAFVPGTESREARWQLRDSVESLTLVGHVGILAAPGATIVAIAPGGAEKVFVTVAPSTAPQEIRQTVKTGKVLSAAGDYRLEIRRRQEHPGIHDRHDRRGLQAGDRQCLRARDRRPEK